jgi:hypothetical protein
MMQVQDNEINYESMVHAALRDVVKTVLKSAEKNGLPGDHHFYICFATPHPRVQLPDHLREEYMEDMTIVLQHEYWDLTIEEESFSITLCFDEIHERITVPFDAIISFVDPSVKFGLQFNPIYPDDFDVLEDDEDIKNEHPLKTEEDDQKKKPDDNVVVIDFSKNKK